MKILSKILLWALLVLSIVVLVKFILFKKDFPFYQNQYLKEYQDYDNVKGWAGANMIPLKTIKRYAYSHRLSAVEKWKNIGGNIIGFIPLGILIPMLFFGFRHFIGTTILIFWISLTFELLQLIFNLGVFDVDDILLNTLGGVLGFVMYKILIITKIIKPLERKKIVV